MRLRSRASGRTTQLLVGHRLEAAVALAEWEHPAQLGAVPHGADPQLLAGAVAVPPGEVPRARLNGVASSAASPIRE